MKASSQPPLPSGKLALAFDKAESLVIAECARHDGKSPEEWAMDCIRGWVTETIDEVHRSHRTKAQKATCAARENGLIQAYHKSVLRAELQISPALYDALNIIAAWESWTFGAMCRLNLISLLECEYGDMLSTIEGNHHSKREKAWARAHQQALAPLMKQLGWNGSTIAREEEAA